MQEYCAEMGVRPRPDFVYFKMDDTVYDISINIFLALLIAAMEEAKVRWGDWDDHFKSCVCQVLRWIQTNGENADVFWDFLEYEDIIEMRGGGARFRIKGCINNYGLEMKEEFDEHGTKKLNDKEIVLRDLQSVTLLLWDGRERAVNHKTDGGELDAWIGGMPFESGTQVQSTISVQDLLLQLKGLLRDA